MREKRSENYWPYAEEIAYKICKLFGWQEIPKAKVINDQDLRNPKYQAMRV